MIRTRQAQARAQEFEESHFTTTSRAIDPREVKSLPALGCLLEDEEGTAR